MKTYLPISAAWAALALSTQAFAQPSFAEFAVTRPYMGKTAKPLLRTEQDKEFKTRLQAAARGKPNFAGQYILATVGCGASCILTSIIDARSGKVAWLPFTICCWDSGKPLDFHLDSSLLVVHGMRDEQEPNGTSYYAFEEGKLRLVAQLPK